MMKKKMILPLCIMAAGRGAGGAHVIKSNLKVTLNPPARRAAIEAFDAQGGPMAAVLEGMQEPGFHKLPMFSNRLQSRTPLVFKLRAGNEALVILTERAVI